MGAGKLKEVCGAFFGCLCKAQDSGPVEKPLDF